MRKQKVIEPQHICDDCYFGTWNTVQWNLDYQGLPITLRCPHYHGGSVGIIRGSMACALFKQK